MGAGAYSSLVRLKASTVDSGQRSRQADNCERVLPSPSCLAGSHEECGHWRGYRGALNPRRLRREGFAMLCGCSCHFSCPVTNEENTVGDPAWRQSCTCPGAEAIREIRDQVETQPVNFSDFRAGWAKYRQESKSRREAFKAAQASAAGLGHRCPDGWLPDRGAACRAGGCQLREAPRLVPPSSLRSWSVMNDRDLAAPGADAPVGT